MTINTNAKLRAAIRQTLDYLWHDEEQDYREGEKTPGHIFETLKALDTWESAK